MSSSSDPKLEPEGNTTSELERLRDILYGEQARTVERRLNEVHKELLGEIERLRKKQADDHKSSQAALEKTQADLKGAQTSLDKRIDDLGAETSKKLVTMSEVMGAGFSDVDGRLQAHGAELNGKLDAVKGNLDEQDAELRDEFYRQLEAASQRLEKQDADLLEKITASKTELLKGLKDLKTRLEQFNDEQSERSAVLQQETHQLDKELRQQLSDALLELGRLLQG